MIRVPLGVHRPVPVLAVLSSPKNPPSGFRKEGKRVPRLSVEKTPPPKPLRAPPVTEFISPHPDAIRRRKEADARRQERQKAVTELTAQAAGRSSDQPSNVRMVDCMRDFEACLLSSKLRGEKVIVHYKSTGCQSCSRLQYKLKSIARENPRIPFVVVDVGDGSGELGQLCDQLGITTVPFFQVYKSGSLVREGSWGDIDLLKSFVPQDMRVCTIGGTASSKKKVGQKIKRCAVHRTSTMDKVTNQEKEMVPEGLEILTQARTIRVSELNQ